MLESYVRELFSGSFGCNDLVHLRAFVGFRRLDTCQKSHGLRQSVFEAPAHALSCGVNVSIFFSLQAMIDILHVRLLLAQGQVSVLR
jgi:hypothetical protein